MTEKSKTFADYIFKLDLPFSKNRYERFKEEVEKLLIYPLKVIALLVTISGIFALVFEVRHFDHFSSQIYVVRLTQTIIGFIFFISVCQKEQEHYLCSYPSANYCNCICNNDLSYTRNFSIQFSYCRISNFYIRTLS
jgi:hypothetical protein